MRDLYVKYSSQWMEDIILYIYSVTKLCTFIVMVMIFVSFILRKWKKVCGNLIETFERLKLKCFRSTLEALERSR